MGYNRHLSRHENNYVFREFVKFLFARLTAVVVLTLMKNRT